MIQEEAMSLAINIERVEGRKSFWAMKIENQRRKMVLFYT